MNSGNAPEQDGYKSAPDIGPTVAASQDLASVLRRNIEMLRERRKREAESASLSDRVAHRITSFTGSMTFVVIHLILFGAWILINLRTIPFIPPFDPTFVGLAMVASVEAIFLSTFVLISQNRMNEAENRRSELDLQINLLAEHEITKLIQLVTRIADRMDVPVDPGVEELKRNVAPEAVLDRIDPD